MNAGLAWYCLFLYSNRRYRSDLHLLRNGNFLFGLLGQLGKFRSEYQILIDWDVGRWNQLVSYCQRLSNAQRLYLTGPADRARFCIGHDFLLPAAACSFTDYVHSTPDKENMDADTKLGILLTASRYRSRKELQDHSNLMKKLLKSGADPRRRGCVPDLPYRLSRYYKEMSNSPLTLFLHSFLETHSYSSIIFHDELSVVLNTVTSFFSYGSNGLDIVCFRLPNRLSPHHHDIDFVKMSSSGESCGGVVLACFPVHSVIARLMQKLRSRRDLADNVSNLQKTMGGQDDGLKSHHKLWFISLDNGSVKIGDGQCWMPGRNLKFWEFPATE